MYGVVLWLMFEVIANVYVTNQRAGLYPPEADSVSIPIYSMAFFLMLSTLPLTLLSILPQSRFVERVFRRSVGWRRFGGTLMAGLYGFGILFALGGGNGSHSHNDIGSYTIGLGSEQPTGDVGNTQYSAKTFSKERYTIAGISSWGHPVPVVAGSLQGNATTIKPKVISTRFSDEADEISINMADAYAVPTLRSLTRTLLHDRAQAGSVTITDRFEYTQASRFEVALTTLGKWAQNPDGSIDLWQQDERLAAHIEASGAWSLTASHSNEEGLAFTRIGIALRDPQISGHVTIRFEPAKPVASAAKK